MTNPTERNDQSLDAIDFIVNVLREHEKTFDMLINRLGSVTEKIDQNKEADNRIEKVEQQICSLQNQIANFLAALSQSPQTQVLPKEAPMPTMMAPREQRIMNPTQTPAFSPTPLQPRQPPRTVTLNCKNWDDFQALAFEADTISFSYKDGEKTFRADALKGNQLITYTGELKLSSPLKCWLGQQLNIPEKKVVEGALFSTN
jgi:hypothetical protein